MTENRDIDGGRGAEDPWSAVVDQVGDAADAAEPGAPEPRDAGSAEWDERAEAARRAAWEREVERARAEGRDPLTVVAREARRLLDSLQDRAAREIGRGLLWGTRKGIGQVFGGGGGGQRGERDVWEEAIYAHEDGYICRSCPVCRVIAARREAGQNTSAGVGTDIADHLVAAGGELVTALREAVDALARPAPPRRPRDDRDDPGDRGEHNDPG
ncbi:hypothetical protein [Spongiactinospora gelatinilytica]|uniref:hypothetical protein n=1 Tax=Spongiactinospora gelatinilytica TaxID=2666298 RepID=UPI0011B941DC|nr:hypothetical protein [Spongiactinospora gelatinilytica]